MKDKLVNLLVSIRDKALDESYTDSEIENLREGLKVVCTEGFDDPVFKKFMTVISKRPFEPSMQILVGEMVEYFNEKGFETPCASGCSEDCALHEIEFGGI